MITTKNDMATFMANLKLLLEAMPDLSSNPEILAAISGAVDIGQNLVDTVQKFATERMELETRLDIMTRRFNATLQENTMIKAEVQGIQNNWNDLRSQMASVVCEREKVLQEAEVQRQIKERMVQRAEELVEIMGQTMIEDPAKRTTKSKLIYEVLAELNRALSIHGNFASWHEAYAVIQEEVEELWDDVKKNNHKGARAEALQVTAMGFKALLTLPLEETSK
jgi:hypothetical protein